MPRCTLLLVAAFAAPTTATAVFAENSVALRSTRGRGLLQQLVRATAQGSNLVAPQPNDTIPQSYWNMIDERIDQYASQTTAPTSVNEQPTAEPDPYEQIYTASRPKSSATAEDLTPEEIANGVVVSGPSPAPDTALDAFDEDTHERGSGIPIVPYTMAVGARLMYGMTEKGTSTPAPSQGDTSAQFVAQCPMIMFNTQLFIEAPRCGETWGAWQDPGDDYRPVLRWEPRSDGGINYGVDSVVHGEGAATYAKMKQDIGVSSVSFQLANCMSVTRYYVNEEVVKVNHVSQGITSTATNHDTQSSGEAYFYRYTIRAANGTDVAQTDLFRLNQNSINITMFNDEATSGAQVLTATRVGSWTGDKWKSCDGTRRGWQVTMQLDSREVDMVATVMDLRVAATAVINLMAYRDETVDSSTGTTSAGQGQLYKQLGIAILLLIIAFILFVALLAFCKAKGVDAKCRRFCFKLEAAFLPKRPAWKRSPALNPTY